VIDWRVEERSANEGMRAIPSCPDYPVVTGKPDISSPTRECCWRTLKVDPSVGNTVPGGSVIAGSIDRIVRRSEIGCAAIVCRADRRKIVLDRVQAFPGPRPIIGERR